MAADASPRPRSQAWGIASVIVTLVTLPALLYTISLATSTAVGLLLAVLLISARLGAYLTRMQMPRTWVAILVVSQAWVLLPLVTAAGVGAAKIAGSMSIVLILVLFAALLSTALAEADDEDIAKGVAIAFLVFVVIGWAGAILNILAPQERSKQIFPFNEPSHFALCAGPTYLAALVALPPRWRKYVYLNTVLQAALFPSLIMFMYFVLMVLASMRRPVVAVAFVSALVFSVWTYGPQLSIPVDYFADRLNISADSSNLSVLYFLQGWTDAYRSIVETHGIGWGFQMTGLQSPNAYALKIYELVQASFNGGDGGAGLGAKIIAEFGAAGLLMTTALFVRCAISLAALRRAIATRGGALARGVGDQKTAIAHAIVVAFVIELLLRNLGFFSPGVVLLLVAFLQLRRVRKRSRAASRPPIPQVSHA